MSSGLTNRLVAGLPPMMMMPPVTASNSSFRSTRAAWLFSIWLIGLSVWSLVSDCGPHVSVAQWLGRAHDLVHASVICVTNRVHLAETRTRLLEVRCGCARRQPPCQ